jgi:hypothetical protein
MFSPSSVEFKKKKVVSRASSEPFILFLFLFFIKAPPDVVPGCEDLASQCR